MLIGDTNVRLGKKSEPASYQGKYSIGKRNLNGQLFAIFWSRTILLQQIPVLGDIWPNKLHGWAQILELMCITRWRKKRSCTDRSHQYTFFSLS